MGKYRNLLSVVALAVVIVGGWFLLSPKPAAQDTQRTERSARKRVKMNVRSSGQHSDVRARDAVRSAMEKNSDGKKIKGKRRRAFATHGAIDDLFPNLEGADKVYANAIQDALDDDDEKGILELAELVKKCENPEVREHLVDALCWIGEDAMPELTELMSDKNPDVAEAATEAWQHSLFDMDFGEKRYAVAETAMKYIKDPDVLEMLSGELSAIDDDLRAVEAMASVIMEGNPVAAAKAREAYEELTDEKWNGLDSAENWLAENYEPDDDDEMPASKSATSDDSATNGGRDEALTDDSAKEE